MEEKEFKRKRRITLNFKSSFVLNLHITLTVVSVKLMMRKKEKREKVKLLNSRTIITI